MLTTQELLHALLLPALVSAVLASIARWRRWPWAIPVAAALGFLTGYALTRMPTLPPRDGVDWLFWLTLPLAAAAITASVIARPDLSDRRPAWTTSALGLSAGLVALVIMLPLTRVGAVPVATTVWMPFLVGLVGAGLLLALHFAIDRLGPVVVTLALSIVVAGAGVMVMSSNLRIVGVYALSAAAAVASAGALCWDARGASGVSVLTVAIVAGLLTAGRYYPEPGVRGWEFALIYAAPFLLAAVGSMPQKRRWVRGLFALALVAVFIGVLTIPKALAAKKAAEEDPYGGMYP